jgi:hypothetical protein
MIIKEKNILYNFSVSIEKEVEEEVEKKSKRKNKDTGKMEVVTSKESIAVKKEVPFEIFIKKPNRAELEDGDMFYSLELNKFIKMGLLTKAMLAKQYGNQGGVWSEKEQKMYGDLLYKMHQKQLEVQQFSILGENGKLSKRQQQKLADATKEMSEVKRDLTEYEMVQNSLFDHTADVKARNRAIMWYILNLSYFKEGENENAPFEKMFEGDDFDAKYESYEEKEEAEDELYQMVVDKISSIVTLWYISGEQNSESLSKMFDSMKKDAEESSESEEEKEEQEEQEEELVTQDG